MKRQQTLSTSSSGELQNMRKFNSDRRSLWGSAISEVWGHAGSLRVVYLQKVCLLYYSLLMGHMQPLAQEQSLTCRCGRILRTM